MSGSIQYKALGRSVLAEPHRKALYMAKAASEHIYAHAAGAGRRAGLLRCVTGEDIVAILGGHVTWKASSMLRFVGRLAVLVKLSVPPPAGCSVAGPIGLKLRVIQHHAPK
jgi:hypothetical protein